MLEKDNLSIKSMPQGVLTLCLIQAVSTLGYSILYSTLVLYMRGKLGMPVITANSIMGVFIAFNFGLHLFGGYLGGRFTSYRAVYCAGMVAQIIGSALLALQTENSLYYGLAVFLTGAGLNITCLYCMLTQRFDANDNQRQTAFLWNYACMNAGFFLGFTLSGYFQLIQNYPVLFMMGALGNVFALILCVTNWHKFADKETVYALKTKQNQIRGTLFTLFILLIVPPVLVKAIQHADLANQVILFMGIAMLILVGILAIRQDNRLQRNKLFAFALLCCVSLIFWTLYQLAPMGLMHFINNNVQRDAGFLIIPPQWFQNVNTICIVVGGPLLSFIIARMEKAGKPNRVPVKFALALFLIGIAFIILPLGISRAGINGLVHPGWIVVSFALQSIGELLISPIGYAMIGALAPVNLQGILMGVWMLCNGVGATIASYSSNWMSADHGIIDALVTNPDFSAGFLILGLLGLMGALLVYCAIPVLNRLMYQTANPMNDTDSSQSSCNNEKPASETF